MAKIVWDSAWNIGHEEIDKQHQEWIGIFNRLEDAVFSEEIDNLVEVQRGTLKDMLEYTRYHFSMEEQIMVEISYPDAASHWRLHKNFDTMIYEKYRAHEEGEYVLNSNLLLLIQKWLLSHIRNEDQKIGRHLRGLSV
jgi:hemerythrin